MNVVDFSARPGGAGHETSVDVDAVRAFITERDPQGVLPPCHIRSIVIGDDVLGGVAEHARALAPNRGRCVLLVDPVRIRRGSSDVKDVVESALRQHFTVERAVLDDGTPTLHASDEVLDAATEAVRGAAVVVTVGGGTVTDIGKWACSRDALIPLVVVQTAASVDGFTDDVSVVLRSGVKRTLPSRWPDVIVSDVATIADAPGVMNRAGYGEMVSMFLAPVDWFLAGRLGLDPKFHEGPVQLLATASAGVERWSPGIAQGESASVRGLVGALAVRGITTGISGSTAVLSGAEHLVSHMLDVRHGLRGERTGLHGAQVGVGSLVAAAAHELFVRRLDGGGRPEVPDADRVWWRARVGEAFDHLDPSGAVAAECWRDVERKLDTWSTARDEVTSALGSWPSWRDEVTARATPIEVIASRLASAGAVLRFEDLDPVVAPETAHWAVSCTPFMRNRFTVVDVLALLGWWDEEDVTEVMDRARAASETALSQAGGIARG